MQMRQFFLCFVCMCLALSGGDAVAQQRKPATVTPTNVNDVDGTPIRMEAGRVVILGWLPPYLLARPKGSVNFVVLFDGRQGRADKLLEAWSPFIQERLVLGVLAVQWWLGGERYLTVDEAYKLTADSITKLATRYQALSMHENMLYGRGAAADLVSGLALRDRGTKRNIFTHVILDNGGWRAGPLPTFANSVKKSGAKGLLPNMTFYGYAETPDAQREINRVFDFAKEQGAKVREPFSETGEKVTATPLIENAPVIRAIVDDWKPKTKEILEAVISETRAKEGAAADLTPTAP